MLLGGVLAVAVSGAPPAAAQTAGGISGQAVFWIAVSPRYAESGLVATVTNPLGRCPANCTQLWISHDGGASWRRSGATGWQQGRVTIAIDHAGHEVLFSQGSSAAQRSDDGGDHWTAIGQGGVPATSPAFARDATVAVAGASDYVVHGATSHPVAGSGGGTLRDVAFAFSPSYPAGGSHAPVLLSAADTKSGLPVMEQCSADFTCSGPTTLPDASTWSVPVTLYPSSDFADDGVVFAQSGRGIYKSADGGKTFVPLTILSTQNATPPSTAMLALAPGYREAGPVRTAYASAFQIVGTGASQHGNGGVYRTTDGGATWSRVGSPSPLDAGATAVAVGPDGRLFAGYVDAAGGGHAGLLCSVNGTSWAATCPAIRRAAQLPKTGSPGANACATCPAGAATGDAAQGGTGRSASTPGGESVGTSAVAAPRRPSSSVLPVALGVAAAVAIAAAAAGTLLRRRRRFA